MLNELTELFENVKTYGWYVKSRGIFDCKEYWKQFEQFIQAPEQARGVKELENTLSKGWELKMFVGYDMKAQTSDIKVIFNYVHRDLRMHGLNTEKTSDYKWLNSHLFLRPIEIPYNNTFSLMKLLHIAYYLGQLSVVLENPFYTLKAREFFEKNNMDSIESYINLNNLTNKIISEDVKILVDNTNTFILAHMNLSQTGGIGNSINPFYTGDIEELTLQNNDYRKVLYTGPNQQFVLMSIKPLDDIKMEVHETHDQFFNIVEGTGKAILGTNKNIYDLAKGVSIIVPANTLHQIINTGKNNLKLFTLYSPPEHPAGTINNTNPDKNIIIESDEYLNQKDLNKQILNGGTKTKLINDFDYIEKYLEYKNKYIIFKNFMKKYYGNS